MSEAPSLKAKYINRVVDGAGERYANAHRPLSHYKWINCKYNIIMIYFDLNLEAEHCSDYKLKLLSE